MSRSDLSTLPSSLRLAGRLIAATLALLCVQPTRVSASQQAGVWSVDPDPEFQVGWATGQPETDFFDIVGAAGLPDGSIAIADRGLASVTVVGEDGSVRFAVGGTGDGPGEFAGLAQLLVDDRGHLYAYDSRHQRLTEWTGEGGLVGTATVSRAAAGRRLDALGRFDNGEWYAREAPRLVATRVDETAQDTVGVFRIDLDGLVRERIANVPGLVATQVMVGGRAATRHVMFSPRALDTRLGNCLIVMTSDEPVLRVLDAGGVSRGEISLPVPVRSTSATDRRSWIDGVLENNEAPPEMAAVVEQMGEALAMADVWPVAHRIVADSAGYVWLERFEAPEGPSGNWIVVDGTGAVVAQPTLPDGFQLLEVERDRVIGIWTDELDRQHVRVHALRREPSQRETPLSGCT